LSSAQIEELLLSHPAVAQCEFIDGFAYVVLGQKDGSPKSMLGNVVEDWELNEYLVVKMLKAGAVREDIPVIRRLDSLPEQKVPFKWAHVLGALFCEIDKDRKGEVSFKEFASFCRKRNLFNTREGEVEEVFLATRKMASASEILWGGGSDIFRIPEFQADNNNIRFYDFQKLIRDAGLIEIRVGERGDCVYHAPSESSYFVDERIADIIVKRWFAVYDIRGAGHLALEDYVKLVADYDLPFAASEEAFHRLDTTGCGGLDLESFRALLVEAGILETGTSVEKDDETGKVWREIKDTQYFRQQRRVFVADGRAGTSPPKRDGVLRFVCISDTHGRHRDLTSRLPEGDVLLHAGDFTMAGGMQEVVDFGEWLQGLPYRRKVVIAGNHDLTFDRAYHGDRCSGNAADAEAVRRAFEVACRADGEGGVVYLEDETHVIEGVRIYGTPWQPEFGYWAFNLPRGAALLEKWRRVPANTDVLMVHGPPLGRGDECLPSLRRAGCADLLTEIQARIRPQFVVCGHVHEGAGVFFDGTTHYLNACSLDEHYDCIHPPLVFDMEISA